MIARRTLLAATLATPALAKPVLAQSNTEWPDRPVRILIGFGAGGVSDVATRLLLEGLRPRLPGSVFVVENRSGASGMVAAALVARAAPDGYALLGAPGTIAIVPSMMKTQQIDVLKDLAPINLFATSPNVLVVHPDFPARTVAEFVAHVKAKPKDELAYAHSGIGTTVQLMMGMVTQATGLSLRDIPYRSSNESIAACVAGQVPMVASSTNSALSFIQAGQVRALAVASPRRSSFLPDVPTFAESGLPSVLSDTWFGLFAPPATDPALVQRISTLCDQVMADPAMRQRFALLGAEPVGLGPAAFAALMAREVASFRTLTRQMGLQPE